MGYLNNKDKLIVKQAIKIMKLEEKNKDYKDRLIRIKNLLVCIDALNDNVKEYSTEQKKIFFEIEKLCK